MTRRDEVISIYLSSHSSVYRAVVKRHLDHIVTLVLVLLEGIVHLRCGGVEGEAVDQVGEDESVVHGVGCTHSSGWVELTIGMNDNDSASVLI